MDNTKNFHETIKELEKKLGESVESLVDTNVKYRSAQDKIDHLGLSIFETKVQILELTYLMNDLLTKLEGLAKLDSKLYIINVDDLKKLNNVEALRLINNAMRFLNTKF